MSSVLWISALMKIVCFIIALLLSLVHSLLIILIPRFHCRSNLLTLNLSLAFTCCCIYWLVYCLLWDCYNIDLSSKEPCALFMYIQLACNCQLAFAFIVIPIHRYFSIVYYSKIFFQTKKWLILCLTGQWLMGLLVPLPVISARNPNCIRPQWISIYQLMVIIVIPSLISFAVNAVIYIHVRSSFRRVRCSLQDEQSTTHRTSQVKISRRDIHLLRNIVYTFSVFIGGWGPIFGLLAVTHKGQVAPLVLIILAVWAEASLFSIIINLFRYNPKLREYLKNKILRKIETP